ncbi:MAG: hypothetical protein WBA74_21505 [Cyclobacteriaceae bacterium]
MKKPIKSISSFEMNKVNLETSRNIKGGEVHVTVEWFGLAPCPDIYSEEIILSDCGNEPEKCLIQCD